MATLNSFPPGAFPEHRLNCTQLSNGTWHCSPVEQQCVGFVELGVVCKNYKDLYNDCSMNCTLLATTQSPTTKQGKIITMQLYRIKLHGIPTVTKGEAVCANNTTVEVINTLTCTCTDDSYTKEEIPKSTFKPADNSTSFTVGIGVLAALLLAASVGWIASCVILLRRGQTVHKQQ